MIDIPLEQMVLLLGYFGIFLLMTTNGLVGFPSSQLLYILCGYFIFTGDLNWAFVILVGALGNTLGNIMLYEIVRHKGVDVIKKYKLFQNEILIKVERAFQKKGAWFLFFGKLTPALKVFAPVPPALGKMRRDLYIAIIFFASLIWTLPFLAIGYIFGKSANVLGNYVLILLVISAIIGIAFYQYVKRQEISPLK